MNAARPLAATLVAALVLASSSRARAQTYAPPPPPVVHAPAPSATPPPQYFYARPLVPLALEGDAPGMKYEVVGPKGDDHVYARCVAPCRLELPAGSYRVRVDGDDIPTKQQAVALEGATRVYSKAGSSSAKNGGLALAISGTSVAGIGLAVALVASMSAGCGWGDGGCSDSPSQRKRQDEARSTAGIALAVAGVGALLGTVGWITFASNRTKMSVEGAYAGPSVSFGVAPTLGGASFALTGTF